jgi:hypothetical protein
MRHKALLVLDVVLEFIPIVLDECAHRHGSGVAERTDRSALDVIRNVVEQIEIFVPAAPVLDAIHHPIEPPCAFAAGRALTA